MGRLAKLKSFIRVIRNSAKITDVKFDPGGGPNITGEHFASAGDDSFPLVTDYLITNELPREGGEVVVGYLDPLNTPKAQEGEKRIYARDSSGAVVGEVWLKNDGTILSSNANGSNMLRPDGGSVTTTPASTFDAAASGSIKGDNGNGSFELQSGGDFVVNGVTIDTAGNITSPATVTAVNMDASTSLKVNGVEQKDHDHAAGSYLDSGSGAVTGRSGPT